MRFLTAPGCWQKRKPAAGSRNVWLTNFGRNSCGWCVGALWISLCPSGLTTVQKAYTGVSEWELRARKSGKLPLALPWRRDFPLLRPRGSPRLFPKQKHSGPPTSHQRTLIFFHIYKPNDWADFEVFKVYSAARRITLCLLCWQKLH